MSNHLLAPAAPAFRPSSNQRRLLDYIHEHPSFSTILELCAAAGVGRTTYYTWCKDPRFRLWLSQAWSARLLMDGAVLLNIARVQATRSFSYWKALADLTFDPKGLGTLQKWQQSCFQAEAAAFDTDSAGAEAPEALSPAPPEAPEPPTGVPALSKSNQQLTVENGTNRPLVPAAARTAHPHRIASHYQAAFRRVCRCHPRYGCKIEAKTAPLAGVAPLALWAKPGAKGRDTEVPSPACA